MQTWPDKSHIQRLVPVRVIELPSNSLDIDYQKIRQFFPSLHPLWMLNQKRSDKEMLKYASNENNNVKKSAFRELVDREY
jgi:hypothetical protein